MDRKGLCFLWRYAKPHLSKLAAAFLTSLPIAALGGIIAWSIKEATQSFTHSQTQGAILIWLGLAILFMILFSCLQTLNTYILSSLHATIGNHVRIDLYNEIQQNSISFHSNIRTGELSNLIGNDSQYAAAGVIEIYYTFWQRPIIIICLTGFMFYMNPVLTIMSLILFPLLSLCIIKISRKARNIEGGYIENQGQLMGDMIESLTNIRQVKAFNQETTNRQMFAEKSNRLIVLFKKVVFLKALVSPTTEILSSIVIAAMAIVAYSQLHNGTTTPGAITGCLTAFIYLKRVSNEMSSSIVELQRSFAAVHRIGRLSGYAEQFQKMQTLQDRVKSLTFENVSFSYDMKLDIIKDASFELTCCERIAVIGPSGGGKTSLLNMITGFYPCTAGTIRVNGMNLADISLHSWRNQIAIVSQEPFLFETSILENIRYGLPDANMEQVLSAIDRAGCSDIIDRLHDGIDTKVGERGCRLSGGERKRIALARALIRPISILLLDEATSELDSSIEEKILGVIDTLANDMIIINVSHRPSAIRHSDRVLVVDAGKIIEVSPKAAENFLNLNDTYVSS